MAGWMDSLSNSWGSMFGTALPSGIGSSSLASSFDWGSALSSIFSGGSGSSSSSSSSFLSNLFGGSGSSTSSDIFKAILGGIGGYAGAVMDEKAVKQAGEQQRKTVSFQAQLADYYNQKDKVRKRAALDTYGQFSLLDRYAPNRTPAPSIDMPTMPKE